MSGQLREPKNAQTLSGQLANAQIWQTKWTLSWSHYLFLLGIKDPDERAFYEIEATNEGWSLRELRRQFDSSLYERLALSLDKESILALATDGQLVEKPQQLLKNPYVLEFLDLREETRYSERELERVNFDTHFNLHRGSPCAMVRLCR